MDIEFAARIVLGLEALACLWLGLMAWGEARHDLFLRRIVGPMLWWAAAAVMVYGLVRL